MYLRNNGWKCLKFDEKSRLTDPCSLANPKKCKHKENYTQALYSQIAESQSWKENIKSIQRKDSHYIQQTRIRMITGSSETKEAEKVHEIASVYYWKEKKIC